MVESIKADLVESAQPIVVWLQGKGMDFACDVIAASLIFLAGVIAIKILSRVLCRMVERNVGNRELLKRFVMSIVVKCAWAFLIVIVLEKLGVSVAPLIAGLGVTGFVLGFAFQESLGSLAAGIMLAFNQPFKIGDYVALGGHEGKVLKLDMMAVVLATNDNRKVTIPNKQAWGSAIVNFSALDLRRIDIPVGISYDSDVDKARELACATLTGIPYVQKSPAPMAEVQKLDDSAVVLTCRAWVKNADYWPAFFTANRLLLDAFTKSGISIPFPQLDVHVVKNAEAAR